MNKKLNLYYFGDIGVYDEYCPDYVCSKTYASEILYIIAENKPFTISDQEIIKTLKIEEDHFKNVISSLQNINLIDVKDNTYKVNFPVFLEKDLVILDRKLENIGNIIGDKIINNSELIYSKIKGLTSTSTFSKERLLYHIICDSIFDGTAFDYFSETDLFCISKSQPGNRDYIVIAYEDNKNVEAHSNNLLCSSNNFRTNRFNFNSFGDSNGNRKDMYRVFRITQQSLENATNYESLNLSYIKILDVKNREISEQCGELILKIHDTNVIYEELTDTEKYLATFLIELNYLKIDEKSNFLRLEVPIIKESDIAIIDELSLIILDDIFDVVKDLFSSFEVGTSDLTAIKHEVNIKEIANELWHQIFGLTNEYLGTVGFVESPNHIVGEGRYLKSFRAK